MGKEENKLHEISVHLTAKKNSLAEHIAKLNSQVKGSGLSQIDALEKRKMEIELELVVELLTILKD